MKSEEIGFFVNPKPTLTLIAIRRNSMEEMYASKLATKVDTTYAHMVKIVDELEKKGYITSEKKGRKRILELTEKGQESADRAGEFIDYIERNDEGDVVGVVAEA